MRVQFGRRHLLELIAMGGASALAGARFRSRLAHAAGASIPKRLVFFYTAQGALKQFNHDGTIKPQWIPTVVGAPDALALKTPFTTRDFALGDMHLPLAAWQRQILLLDGLDMISADVDTSPSADAHTNGQTHALVGASRQSSRLAGGISIDQLIARGINSPAPVTRLQSLEVAIDSTQGGATGPLFAAAGQPVPIVGNAAAIYARMFPDGAGARNTGSKTGSKTGSNPGTMPGGAAAQPATAVQLAQQRSVLDFAANDFSMLAGRLGKRDADRLDAHAAAIRDLERRLALSARLGCPTPDPISTASASSAGTAAAYAANAEVILRLVQAALACDLTRVVTLCVNQAPNELFGYRPGMSGTADFHDMVHKTNGIPAAGRTVPRLGDDPHAMRTVKDYHAYNAGLFARCLDLLRSIPESDGSTLLDHAAVVWCGDIAGGDHSLDHVPYLIGGGLGGSITPGRYVRLPRRANNKKWPSYSDGIPHNNLFVSLANAMGVEIQTFGNPKVCSGPLVHALT